MKNELVNLLLMYDGEEAKYWAENLNVNKQILEDQLEVEEEDWENEIQENSSKESPPKVNNNLEIEEQHDTSAFHQLSLTDIRFVDTAEKFSVFLDAVKGVTEVAPSL